MVLETPQALFQNLYNDLTQLIAQTPPTLFFWMDGSDILWSLCIIPVETSVVTIHWSTKPRLSKMCTSSVQSQQKISQCYSQTWTLSLKDKWDKRLCHLGKWRQNKGKGKTSTEFLGAIPGKSHLPLLRILAWIEGRFAVVSPNMGTKPQFSLSSSNSTKTTFQRPFSPHHPALSNCLKLAL